MSCTHAVFLFCLLAGVMGCGSVDANDEPDPSPSISVSPGSLAFDEVRTSETEELSFTIENSGEAELSGAVGLTDGAEEYAVVAGNGEYTLGAGATQTVTVEYTPHAEDEHDGVVKVSHNADNEGSPVEVVLSGEGVEGIAPPPDRPDVRSEAGARGRWWSYQHEHVVSIASSINFRGCGRPCGACAEPSPSVKLLLPGNGFVTDPGSTCAY